MAAAAEKAAFHKKKSLACSRKESRTHSHTECVSVPGAYPVLHDLLLTTETAKHFLIPVSTDEKTAPEKLNNSPEITQTMKVQGKVRI